MWYKKVLLAGAVGFIFSACSSIFIPSNGHQLKIEQSPNDLRQYRYLTLENQLRVLLIADSATDKAAASLDVHVGSRHDPVPRLGLAHFLEHMLFFGYRKIP